MALSRAVRDLAYQSCADYALVCPDFVNLGARAIRIDLERVLSDDSKSVEVRRVKAEEVLEQAQYHQRIAQKFLRRSAEAQEQGLDMSKILLKYESKERLQRVLLRAIEIDYIPEEKEIVPLSKSFIKRLAQGDEF